MGAETAAGTPRRVLDGAAWSLLAEALVIPTGILTAAFLTRRLGPEAYGLFVLGAALVSWVEWSVTSIFARTTVKFVSAAKDWRPVAAAVVRQHLLVSIPVALAVWLLADPIARGLDAPVLERYVRLFAVEIPLFSLARAHRSILTGLEGYRGQAVIGAVRWVARFALIVLFVELGLSVTGAIIGSIGATAVELAMCRVFVRPSFLLRSRFPTRQLWGYAVPLFVAAMSQRLFTRADILALKALGASAAQVGIYGAAENIALFPGLIAMSISPVLLAAVGRLLRAGDQEGAREIGRGAIRGVLLLLPFAALIAGSAHELARLVFGPAFSLAGPIMALLVFGALGLLMVAVVTSLLIAADRPRWTLALMGPPLPVAVVGHVLIIPRFGAIGAATVTTVVAGATAIGALVVADRLWRIRPPAATLLRSILVGIPAYAVAVGWQTPGLLLLPKTLAIVAGILAAYVFLGELGAKDLALARGMIAWPVRAEPGSAALTGDSDRVS